MSYENILVETRGRVGLITLNRPKALNVYNIKMRDELYQVFGAVREDDEVRVGIIQGAGDRAFCAGADLSEFLTAPPPVFARQARFDRDIWGVFLSVPQPIIAALHGYVLGSGVEIALFSDIRIAADNTQFGVPEMGLGIIPAAGATRTLPAVVGRGYALEMLLSGRYIKAPEALHMGLVNRVVPRADLLTAAEKLAGEIKSVPATTTRLIKEAISRGLDMGLPEGLELESRLAARALAAVSPWSESQR